AAALSFAARALAESHALNRELFWISDFQAAGLADSAAPATGDRATWERSRVYLIPLEPRTRANLALTDVAPAPSDSGAALALTGAAYGEAPGDVAVAVRESAPGGAELGRGYLDLRSPGAGSALLPLARAPAAGGEARLPGDAWPFDDARW